MKIQSMEHAIEVIDTSHPDSEECLEAMVYLLEHAPQDIKKLVREKISELFPNLKPDLCDAEGNRHFSGRLTQAALGMSNEEMVGFAEEHPEHTGAGKALHRVH
jgi:hypothetical protein